MYISYCLNCLKYGHITFTLKDLSTFNYLMHILSKNRKKVKVKSLSRVQLFEIPWAVAQVPPSMGFSRQEYWSGLPFPSPLLSIDDCI